MNKNSHSVRPRIITDAILFFAVLYAPWWFLAPILFLSAWYFKNFYEAFFFGFLFDVFYGVNVSTASDFRFFFSSSAILLVFLVDFVKGKMRV